jgi:Gluconate 2-dehydrogenase subunit 3
MTINRRIAIRQLAFLSVGAALLPACRDDRSKPDLALKNFKVDDKQQKLLEELTATLIPTTSTPGAREVSAHLFILKMLDDCSSRADQDKFFSGMKQFELDYAARSSAGKSFVASSTPQRESFLLDIESKRLPNEDLNFFYSTAKRSTILAYSSSQFFLTRVQVYELVPGRWHGCIPVQQKMKSAS